jgi:hypothetical protein
MRHALLLLAILSVAIPSAPAKKKYDWQSGRVLGIVQERYFPGAGTAEASASNRMTGGSMIPEIRESLDIEGDTAVYTIERIVFFRFPLRLQQGDPVRFAIDGNAFMLRTGGKEYKFKSFRSSRKMRFAPR